MADYNPNQFMSNAESRVIQLESELRTVRAELNKYKDKEKQDDMKRLDFSPSPVGGYVECNDCAGLFRVERMQFHRDRCE